MMTAFHEARRGTVRLDDAIVLRKEDKVGGSGVLREFHTGLQITLLDAINLMIVVSDNTGTNLVMDAVGRETVNPVHGRQRMQRMQAGGPSNETAWQPIQHDNSRGYCVAH